MPVPFPRPRPLAGRRLHVPARAAAAAALGALLGACASSGSPATGGVSMTPQTTRVAGADGNSIEARTVTEDRSTSVTVDASADKVWARMAAVYAELELPVSTLVDANRQIAAQRARFRRRMGRTPLARYVTCGTDMSGDDRANSYEVTLDVVSTVAPVGADRAAVTTQVSGSARPLGTAGDVVRCVTTGNLEKTIANLAGTRAAAGG